MFPLTSGRSAVFKFAGWFLLSASSQLSRLSHPENTDLRPWAQQCRRVHRRPWLRGGGRRDLAAVDEVEVVRQGDAVAREDRFHSVGYVAIERTVCENRALQVGEKLCGGVEHPGRAVVFKGEGAPSVHDLTVHSNQDWECDITRRTRDIELVHLRPQRFLAISRLALENIGGERIDESRSDDIQARGESGEIHFPRLAIQLVEAVLLSDPERS
ncbi:hypothetical protein DFH09DRAFT_1285224 [Mycena vulgaris]|nr:hypothetical protein DFH09DRAFT_1285224 [Mycena vulgaris]